jgi:hypothetical protein
MNQQFENLNMLKDEVRNLYPDEWPNLVKEPVFRGRERTSIPGISALTDLNTGTTYSFVTKEYQVLLHEEAAHTLHQSVLKLKDTYPDYKITHQFLNNGAKYVGKVQFGSITKDVKKGDPIAPFILIKNSYDKSWARDLSYGATQLVCSNGLVRPVIKDHMKVRHLRNAGITEMEEHIHQYLSEEFSHAFDTWQLWSETKLSMERAEELWAKLPFTIHEVNKMTTMPLMGNNKSFEELAKGDEATVWDMNRAATQYLTHNVKSNMRQLVDVEVVSKVLTKHFN